MKIVLTDSNFKDEISSGVVLVDFWAPWCGPCRMLSPIIDEISNELNDIKIGSLNVDENPVIASEFQIMSIPAVMIFKDNELVETIMGLRPKDAYLEVIKKHQ